jgi:hypothetical protein
LRQIRATTFFLKRFRVVSGIPVVIALMMPGAALDFSSLGSDETIEIKLRLDA